MSKILSKNLSKNLLKRPIRVYQAKQSLEKWFSKSLCLDPAKQDLRDQKIPLNAKRTLKN